MSLVQRPMLACQDNVTEADLPLLLTGEPVWVTEKFDGIRCLLLCRDKKLRAMSRSMKEIPNYEVQSWAEDRGIAGLDGELIIRGGTFQDCQSFFMTRITMPRPKVRWQYMVIDWTLGTMGGDDTYLHRVQTYRNMLQLYDVPRAFAVHPVPCTSVRGIMREFETVIARGGEGLIIRSPSGKYKQGRATWNEGTMYKMKQFEDREAIIIDCYPLQTNTNEQSISETGYSKRSSHKSGLVPRDLLGGFECRDLLSGREFDCGSGFSQNQRQQFWIDRERLKGKVLTYKFQVQGVKVKPRSPIFKGIRKD